MGFSTDRKSDRCSPFFLCLTSPHAMSVSFSHLLWSETETNWPLGLQWLYFTLSTLWPMYIFHVYNDTINIAESQLISKTSERHKVCSCLVSTQGISGGFWLSFSKRGRQKQYGIWTVVVSASAIGVIVFVYLYNILFARTGLSCPGVD